MKRMSIVRKLQRTFLCVIIAVTAVIICVSYDVYASEFYDDIDSESMSFFVTSEEKAKKIAEEINCQFVYFKNDVATVNINKPYKNTENSMIVYIEDYDYDREAVDIVTQEEYEVADKIEKACEMGITLYEEHIYYAESINSEWGYIGDEQWYASYIGIPEAWKYSNGKGATVAVIDSGVLLSHGELKKRIIKADTVIPDENYVSGSGASPYFPPGFKGPQDNAGHGTHVCGIVAAANDNYGSVGIAPSCNIISIKAIDKATDNVPKGKTSWLVRGINEAIELKADVINLSIGGSTLYDSMLDTAIKKARQAGIAVVCAAGNIDNGTKKVIFPAAFDGAIGVAGLKQTENSLEFDDGYSNYGSIVDVSAPGTHIYSTDLLGYSYKTGTSMAAPMVAASLAMLRTINPDITLSEMESFLYNNATDLGETGADEYYGRGALNTEKMLKACYDEYKIEEEPSEKDDNSESEKQHNSFDNSNISNECDVIDGHDSQIANQTLLDETALIPGIEPNMMYALENSADSMIDEKTDNAIKNSIDKSVDNNESSNYNNKDSNNNGTDFEKKAFEAENSNEEEVSVDGNNYKIIVFDHASKEDNSKESSLKIRFEAPLENLLSLGISIAVLILIILMVVLWIIKRKKEASKGDKLKDTATLKIGNKPLTVEDITDEI